MLFILSNWAPMSKMSIPSPEKEGSGLPSANNLTNAKSELSA
jgi:hypothetical protein